MNETMRQQVTALATRSALQTPADLDGAVQTGMRSYRRRVLWTQAAAVLTVAVLTGVAVGAWSAARAQGSGANTLTGIKVTPASVLLVEQHSRQLRAVGTLHDGSTSDETGSAGWSTGNSKVAEVDPRGLVRGTSPGTTTITATQDGFSASAKVTVTNTATVLTKIVIEPNPISLSHDSQLRATATGHYSDGTSKQLSSTVAWSISEPRVAVVDSAGLVHGIGPGTTTLSATLGDVTATATVTVTSPAVVLTRITIEPSEITLTTNATQQLTATGYYSDGTRKQLSSTATWSTSDPKIAVVDSQGLVRATGPGSSTITAAQGDVTATGAVSVQDVTPSSTFQVP